MKTRVVILGLTMACLLSKPCYANWFQDIINAINLQAAITHGLISNEIIVQNNILSVQQDIDKLMKETNSHITGHSGWGDYHSHDYQSYEQGARNWSSFLQLAESGHGTGEIGEVARGLAREFPINKDLFNRGVRSIDERKYYSLKSKSLLAARTASQVDYNRIQDQINYQQMLQHQIEKTKDIKGAIDLLNRIQVESNLISLEILRQNTLVSQQQTITEQGALNSALANARFLAK